MNIQGLHHFVILCSDFDAAVRQYSTLLGREPDWVQNQAQAETASALFQLENTGVELLAPQGEGTAANRIRELLAGREGTITSLAFKTDDISEAHQLAERRGLLPDEIVSQSSEFEGQSREWKRFRIQDEAVNGLKAFFIEENETGLKAAEVDETSAFRLDHIVINTGNRDRALATYGARLGLRLALDRTNEDWGMQYLFFRLSDLTFEVVRWLNKPKDLNANDDVWGVTFEVGDIEAAYSRLNAAGVAVSEVRTGRKPGTRVMTAKSHNLGIPTLFLEAKAR